MSKPRVLAEPAFVGREAELQELRLFLNSVIQGKGKTVFVSGEAGSGKTRLTREFLNAAIKRGVAVMAGWCLSDSKAPFFPFIEAFNNYYSNSTEQEQSFGFREPQVNPEVQVGTDEREVISWLSGPQLMTRTGRAEMLSPEVWKDQALAAVAKTLHAVAFQAPVILFIEDLHWGDSASLTLLHYLSRVVKDSERVLVLATFRSEELTADAEGHPHPLAETLRVMRREELFSEIKLPNLDKENVSELAESMIGARVQPEFTERLAVQSGGSPLFIVESLRMLNEHGSLVQDGSCVRLDTSKVTIPSKVKDVILRRMGSLRREQRRVLDAAAVIGEEFNVDFLSGVLGQEGLAVLETLSLISDSTSLVVDTGNCYRFDHARSRETLYEELSPSLRRGYHNRIAERLESSPEKSFRLSDLAYHYEQAGNNEKAVKYALMAGKEALARWSNEEAIKHFRYVLQNLPENPENAAAKRKAQKGLGEAYYENNMFKQAMKTFEELGDNETGASKLRALIKAMDSAYQVMDIPHLVELVKKAEPYASADRLESARVLLQRGRTFLSKPQRAIEDYEAALRVFEEEYSLWDVAAALICGPWHAMLGEGRKGICGSLRAFALYGELRDLRVQMAAGNFAGQTFFICQLSNEALGMYSKVMEIAEKTKIGASVRLVYAYAFSSRVYESMGNWEEALSRSLKALELSQIIDTPIAPAMAYSNLTRIYVGLGDLKRAEECFENLVKLPQEVVLDSRVLGNLTKAVFFAVKGQWKESNLCFKEFDSPAVGRLFKSWFAWALEKQGRSEEARVMMEDLHRVEQEANEKFAHVCLQPSLMARREVKVGEDFEVHLDLVNVSRKPGFLVKVEVPIPSEWVKVTALPSWCSLQNNNGEMMNFEIGAFQVVTAKLNLRPMKTGAFVLNAKAEYLDDLGMRKTCLFDPITVTVKPPKPSGHVTAGRVSIGSDEVDDLLGGGIPETYAVILASPSNDERSLLIKRFLDAGAEADQVAFYLTTEAGSGKALAGKFPSNFFLFLCNPRADVMMQSLPNVVKLKGVENLTEIDIALTKAFRILSPSTPNPRRACIEIVSDVLLQHHAVVTRKWLSALIQDLKSKGFTTLAVIDPGMHPSEEVNAALGLFDGEISISQEKGAGGLVKKLKVLKLQGQKYLKDEVVFS